MPALARRRIKEALWALLADKRYLDLGHPEHADYAAHVAGEFKRVYPGLYVPGSAYAANGAEGGPEAIVHVRAYSQNRDGQIVPISAHERSAPGVWPPGVGAPKPSTARNHSGLAEAIIRLTAAAMPWAPPQFFKVASVPLHFDPIEIMPMLIEGPEVHNRPKAEAIIAFTVIDAQIAVAKHDQEICRFAPVGVFIFLWYGRIPKGDYDKNFVFNCVRRGKLPVRNQANTFAKRNVGTGVAGKKSIQGADRVYWIADAGGGGFVRRDDAHLFMVDLLCRPGR